jgi:L-Ala-D/L-Glu epimerase
VLGNGVASDIGCWMEACVARHAIRNAGEMNGFLRQAAPLAAEPLRVVDGDIQLTPGPAPVLDECRIEEVCMARMAYKRPLQAGRRAS